MGLGVRIYPGVEPHDYKMGTAASFENASEGFEEAWQRLLSKLTDRNFEDWTSIDSTSPSRSNSHALRNRSGPMSRCSKGPANIRRADARLSPYSSTEEEHASGGRDLRRPS
jgi:hypothetical protein